MSPPSAADVAALASERWYADRDRLPVGAERLDALGPLEVVRVAFDRGEPALYTLFEGEPRWDELFARAAGAFRFEGALPPGDQARLEVDQSHTSWRVGGALVKCYRRLAPGVHPEVELGEALGVALPEHVAGLRATLHWEPDDAPPVALAVVHELVEDAEEGWEWAAARAVAGDAGFTRELGAIARRLHEALAGAFPTRLSTSADRADWRAAAESQLVEALALAPDDLGAVESRIRGELDVLGGDEPAELSRVHGDLHVGQFLHAPARTVVVDFEGQPTRDLAERRGLDTPLRDLAALLRSVDHCGRYAIERHGGDQRIVEAWIEEARAETLAGYGCVDSGLLRALELERAVYEFTYASRYLPSWLYAPRAGLEALLAA